MVLDALCSEASFLGGRLLIVFMSVLLVQLPVLMPFEPSALNCDSPVLFGPGFHPDLKLEIYYLELFFKGETDTGFLLLTKS